MRVCRALVFASVLIAAPFAAHAQFGGMPGMPGMPGSRMPGEFGAPPPQSGPPPACRDLLALRDETQKHGTAIQKANERKASVQEACRLFKLFLSAEAKFVNSLEENRQTCGVPAETITQVQDSHAKAAGRQAGLRCGRPGPEAAPPADGGFLAKRLLEAKHTRPLMLRSSQRPLRLYPDCTGCAACAPLARCIPRRSRART